MTNRLGDEAKGFTLLEVVCAMALLVLGATTITALLERSVSAVRDAREHTSALMLARSKLDELASAGSGAFGVAAPASALDADTAGFVEYLDGAGSAVAQADAHFVRRWSIRPLPGGPANLHVLRVLVQNARARGRSLAGSSGKSVLVTTVAGG